jgi:predicted permease
MAGTQPLLGGLALDLRATCRALRRRPAFAGIAVITIALGVGACTTMFSAMDAILLRGLPFAEADRLVAVMPRQFVSNRDIDQFRTRMRSLDQVVSFSPGWLMPLIEVDEPRQVNAAKVSGNMFPMVGVRPLLGRTFGMEAEAPGEGRVAVLGYGLWREVFRSDSGIVGRSVALDGGRYTVIGVMPRGFQLFDWKSDLFVPMKMDRDAFTWAGATGLTYGRLRAGRTLADANAELRTVVAAMRDAFDYPSDWGNGRGVITLQESLVGNVSRMLWLLFGAVVFLLLIATSNVANLLLVRASERRGELALRTSLGAPMQRIARLLLGESLLLGTAGGLLGAGLAVASVRYLPGLLPPDLPRLGEITVNGRILAFALVATLVPSVAFGLAPIAQAWTTGLATALRESRTGALRGERLRGGLVALQVAFSLVLLVGASVMGRSLLSLLTVDRGMRSDHLLTAVVMPSGFPEPERVRAFWREVLPRIEGLPGVTGAATILHLPTTGRTWMADIDVVGRSTAPDQPKPRAAWQAVSTGYFATAGVPILAGRAFTAADHAAAPRVVAVNSAFAARMFPGESALGRDIAAGNATRRQTATIVAVVGGVRHDSLSAPPAPEIYVPIEQNVVYATGLIVRTSTDPRALAAAVQERIWSVNPNVPVTNLRSMDDVFAASLERPRLILGVLVLFAAVGLVLGAVGIYGVVAFGVQQRMRELGIRAALGAGAGSLRALVVRGGVRFALLGVLAGVPMALALSRALRGMVFGVAAADPLSFGVVPVVLVVVACAASWWPARQAARSDPMSVLRED